MPTTPYLPPPLNKRGSHFSQIDFNWALIVQGLAALYEVDTSAGDYAETVPAAGVETSGQTGQCKEIIYVKNSSDGNTFTLHGVEGGDLTLSDQYSVLRVKSDGTNWWSVLNPSGGGSSLTAKYMLGPGIFDLATAYIDSHLTAWSDTVEQVNVVRFTLLAAISDFVFMDGSFGSNLADGSSFAVGIYSDAGALLWSSGAQAVPNESNTAISFAIPSLSLPAGTYYLAWACEDAGNLTMWGWDGPTSMSFQSGTSDANVINQSVVCFGFATNPATSGPTLPATLGTLNPYSDTNAYGVPALFFHA